MTKRAISTLQTILTKYTQTSLHAATHFQVFTLLSPARLASTILAMAYICAQVIIIALFKPVLSTNGKTTKFKPRGRIAVVGAGLTGVSTAAHAIAHGFDVVIFEKGSKVGGIWAHVNATSGLQLNSLLYRFHPAVLWDAAFPHRDEVLGEIRRIWEEYGLKDRTRLETRVESIRRAQPEDGVDAGHARWIVNDGAGGIFDAVVVTVGTCGAPRWVRFPGMPEDVGKERKERDSDKDSNSGEHSERGEEGQEETYAGTLVHSSGLDDVDLSGKRIVVIGSGASGVEAVETALARGASECVIVARQDKWIIPRNMMFDTLISAQPFGREMPLSVVFEKAIAWWNYHGVEHLTPAHLGLFEGTPVVNDEFLDHVRKGQCAYVRGDPQRLTRESVVVNVRERDSKPGDEGETKEFHADVIVLATGFEKPDVGFLEDDLFPEGYERPNLYLQNFATEDWSVLMTNSAYINAIDLTIQSDRSHIGIYTRILLTFLMDRDARPVPKDMKLWVDVLRFVKRGARGGALGFFTYMELTIWLLLFHVFRMDRIKWLFFIMQGWGMMPIAEESNVSSDAWSDKNGQS
ncbi:FAD/NAD(P)-binding domain-containing protein [Wolfiporia cocos MD-104 SS10]|uniref:FAD/NAD(P)-binding domain-containing protein n=1 Tax=Wolfiporia cocos (strain MD-104) TaxID=742152 RepID=A0A2H3JDM9_WOLCO|nr:FAD/NAD(P)-binding domain-containing protein [Wolfiporia cocos MD-104 SS10]